MTVFFDGGCPLCRREIQHYQSLRARAAIRWIDVTREPESLVNAAGLSRREALAVFHVIDRDGHMHKGVSAFVALWRELPGYRWLARLVSLPIVHTVADRAYERFAAWHYGRRCDAACRQH